MRLINVRCSAPLAAALAAAVDRERQVERGWWKRQRQVIADRVAVEGLSTAQRAGLVAAVEAEFVRLRDAGRLRGTRTTYVLPALREVLVERGWSGRRWKPVPPRRGRPWGTHDERFDARVTLHLPDGVGETLVRACHWASQPAVRRLQGWYDTHGDHWRGQLHDENARWSGVGPSRADLAERERLIAGVHTTAGVLREAIRRALGEAER